MLAATFARVPQSLVTGPSPVLSSVTEFPSQVRGIYQVIRADGLFAHDKDDTVFGARERLLFSQVRVFYREHMVKAPRAATLGVYRTLYEGGSKRVAQRSHHTRNHYASFRESVE